MRPVARFSLYSLSAALFLALAVMSTIVPSRADSSGIMPAGSSTPSPVVSPGPDWTTSIEQAPALRGSQSGNLTLADAKLDGSDQIAALEAIQFALTEVGDGAAYVWYRRTGPLSGIVRPTQSFIGDGGAVCRHLEVSLSVGIDTRKVEGVACRRDGGRWALEG